MNASDYEVERLKVEDRRRFYRRVAIAPMCLCLVALLHGYRVRYRDQTPWKGGGFGMFSTVDQGAARYLRVYLLTDLGEIPVAVPQRWEKRATELRAAPDVAGLEHLARDLAEQRWHDASRRWESIAVALATTEDAQPVSAELLHRPLESPAQPSDPFGAAVDVVVAGSETGTGSGANESAGRELAIVPVRDVRIELWRYEFDAATRQLRGRRYLQARGLAQGDA